MQYGLSIERQLGERATGIVSVYSARGIHEFRSVDVNAPTPDSGYTVRPDPAFGLIRQMQPAGFFEGSGLDISYRGRLNKYFSGFGRYTWSHYESNTGGIGWFPQNQYAPNDEWANASFDRRQRLGVYAMFNRESVFNLSTGIFANTGRPWTVLTGTDAVRRLPLQYPARWRRPQHRNRSILCRSRSALGPRFRSHSEQGRRSASPRLLRRRLQPPQPREPIGHRHSRVFA